MEKYKAGDKFIVEIGDVFYASIPSGVEAEEATDRPTALYRIKKFNSLVFDDNGLDRLEKYIAREDETGYQHGYEDGYEKGLRDAVEIPNVETMAIGRCNPGDVVKFAGIEWVILDKLYEAGDDESGVLCLSKDVLFEKEFDEGNGNNWASSTLRNHLNTEFIDELDGVTLLEFDRDLTSDDGLKDYGTCRDKVSLISCDGYRKYRKYISNKDKPWWTLTAYSSPSSGYSYTARFVNTGGTLNYSNAAFDGGIGVAPVCVVLSSLNVERIEEAEE